MMKTKYFKLALWLIVCFCLLYPVRSSFWTKKVWNTKQESTLLPNDIAEIKPQKYTKYQKKYAYIVYFMAEHIFPTCPQAMTQLVLAFLGVCPFTPPQSLPNRIYWCCLSSDDQWFVTGSASDTIHLWHVETGQGTYLEDGSPRAWVFTADTYHLITASVTSNNLYIWEVATGLRVSTLTGHGYRVNHCAVSSDDTLLLSVALDGLRLWARATGTCLRVFSKFQFQFKLWGQFWNNNQFILSAGVRRLGPAVKMQSPHVGPVRVGMEMWAGTVHIQVWSVDAGKCVREVSVGRDTKEIGQCQVSANQQLVVVPILYPGCMIGVWDLVTGTSGPLFREHTTKVTACGFLHGDTWVASVDRGGTLYVWQVTDGCPRHRVQHCRVGVAGMIRSYWLRRTGRSAVECITIESSSADIPHIRVLEVESGTVTHTFEDTLIKTSDVFSDGRFMVTGDVDGTIQIRELK